MDPVDPDHLQPDAAAVRERQRASRRQWLRSAVIALLILIVGGGAVWYFTGGSSESSDSSTTATTTARRSVDSGASDSTAAEIAAYKDAPLLQPAQIPVGWKPLGARLIPKSRSVSGCDEVLIRYGAGADSDVNYLDVYLFPATCDSHRPADARNVTIGTNAGWVSDSDPSLSVLAEVDAGATKVQAETDLSTADALGVLAKLSTLDLAHPPAALLPLDNTTTTSAADPGSSPDTTTTAPVATTATPTTSPVESTIPKVVVTTAPGQGKPPTA